MRTCPIRAQFEDLGAFCALGDYKDSVSYDGSVLAGIPSPVVPAIGFQRVKPSPRLPDCPKMQQLCR